MVRNDNDESISWASGPGAGNAGPGVPAKLQRKSRLLLVDDDEPFLEALAINCEDAGFETIRHADSAAALAWLLQGGVCDAVLLDWYMPGVPGLAFLKELRDAGIETPVIVFTAVDKDVIEDVALASGALDFLDKSRRFSVLLHRLRIVLGATAQRDMPPEEVRNESLLMRRDGFSTYWKGISVPLTVVEYRVVERLASRPGVDFTYRQLYDVVHGEGFRAGDGDDGYRVNVRSMIKRIRQKFLAVDEGFGEIENYTGYGYRWRAARLRPEPVRQEQLSLNS